MTLKYSIKILHVVLQSQNKLAYVPGCHISQTFRFYRFAYFLVLQGVCLVVSLSSNAALTQTLAKKKSTVLFALGQLTMADRKAIVQNGLDMFGKKLSDSAFNNQVLLICFALDTVL